MSDSKDLVPVDAPSAQVVALALGSAVSLFALRQIFGNDLENPRWHLSDEKVAREVSIRDELLTQLVPGRDEYDFIPHGAIEQAKRIARLRTQLLEGGAFTTSALAEGRDQAVAATRQWLHRARRRHEIFTVTHDGETIVPAFLLDPTLHPRKAYAGAIEALTAVGEDGWALWAWLTTASSWLDGAVPAELALTEPDLVTDAARRRASNAL
ncbi:MAG TPA: hypothetical protein VGO60_13480 [Iamia sp.]|jgi:hypothetical protein|nr:hypothetical protein [Iamia sp.]